MPELEINYLLFTDLLFNNLKLEVNSLVYDCEECTVHTFWGLTLTLTSSNYYMSPLSLSACFAPFHVFFT
jgi:hypothetical protein